MSTGLLGLLINAQYTPQQHFWWHGLSGRSIITTIYPLSLTEQVSPSVYIMVRRNADGSRDPLYIGQTKETSRRMSEHAGDKLMSAMMIGGNELHLHYLARTESDRFAVETDLRRRYSTPLNQQTGGLFGLASLYGYQPSSR
ncbi:hypothetical protein BTE77_02380 [Ensifer adhaerens]|nr:hypothetical protein BTE77_02380 [Ensifer adhaerens]